MEGKIFTPNYLKKNNSDDKIRTTERPEPKKKTIIKGKNVIEKPEDVAKILKKRGRKKKNIESKD